MTRLEMSAFCDLEIMELFIFVLSLEHLDAKRAGDLSTLFDVGGIFGKLEYQSLIRPV